MLPKNNLLLLIALITSYATFAQERIYLDKNKNAITQDSAVYYQESENIDSEELIKKIFFLNGTLKESRRFKNKSSHGEYKSFYANGKPEEQGFYKEGWEKGIWNKWYQNGQKQTIIEYPEEMPKDRVFREPIMLQFWDSTGVQHIKEGTGSYFIYDDKGQKIEEGNYEKGLKVGKWIGSYNEYHYEENYEKGKFLNGISQDKNGNKYEYNALEEQPDFPGGQQAMYRYISNNLKYPKEAKRKRVQGKVFTSFVVGRDGKIRDVFVIRGIGGGCDEECVRVVASMPPWKPGKQKGIPVNVKFSMPLFFKLEN